MNDFNDLPNTHWRPEPPAEPKVIQALQSESGLELPEDYLNLLNLSNGGEGELGVEPGWFCLWRAEEVIENNKGYEIEKWLPGFFSFGSSGGGELLAFDTKTLQPWKIYMIPFIPMEKKEALLVAESFNNFAQAIGQVLPK